MKFALPVLAFLAAPVLVSCGLPATQVLADVDKTLNAVCPALTFLPDQVAVCAGVQGAEAIADLVVRYLGQAKAKLPPAARVALSSTLPPRLVRVAGTPVYVPEGVAAWLNAPAENAALRAYVRAGLAVDAGAP